MQYALKVELIVIGHEFFKSIREILANGSAKFKGQYH